MQVVSVVEGKNLKEDMPLRIYVISLSMVYTQKMDFCKYLKLLSIFNNVLLCYTL